jgi:hypothetical protein
MTSCGQCPSFLSRVQSFIGNADGDSSARTHIQVYQNSAGEQRMRSRHREAAAPIGSTGPFGPNSDRIEANNSTPH